MCQSFSIKAHAAPTSVAPEKVFLKKRNIARTPGLNQWAMAHEEYFCTHLMLAEEGTTPDQGEVTGDTKIRVRGGPLLTKRTL